MSAWEILAWGVASCLALIGVAIAFGGLTVGLTNCPHCHKELYKKKSKTVIHGRSDC